MESNGELSIIAKSDQEKLPLILGQRRHVIYRDNLEKAGIDSHPRCSLCWRQKASAIFSSVFVAFYDGATALLHVYPLPAGQRKIFQGGEIDAVTSPLHTVSLRDPDRRLDRILLCALGRNAGADDRSGAKRFGDARRGRGAALGARPIRTLQTQYDTWRDYRKNGTLFSGHRRPSTKPTAPLPKTLMYIRARRPLQRKRRASRTDRAQLTFLHENQQAFGLGKHTVDGEHLQLRAYFRKPVHGRRTTAHGHPHCLLYKAGSEYTYSVSFTYSSTISYMPAASSFAARFRQSL